MSFQCFQCASAVIEFLHIYYRTLLIACWSEHYSFLFDHEVKMIVRLKDILLWRLERWIVKKFAEALRCCVRIYEIILWTSGFGDWRSWHLQSLLIWVRASPSPKQMGGAKVIHFYPKSELVDERGWRLASWRLEEWIARKVNFKNVCVLRIWTAGTLR